MNWKMGIAMLLLAWGAQDILAETSGEATITITKQRVVPLRFIEVEGRVIGIGTPPYATRSEPRARQPEDISAPGEGPFSGDVFSLHHQIGQIIGSVAKCFSTHFAGMDDNLVTFDGITELLDSYIDGSVPFVFEFETGGSSGTGPGQPTGFSINSLVGGDDLFPDGFEDPETGQPLDAACYEIGIDDTLDSDQPVDVTSAILELNNDAGPIFPMPIDITSAFGSPWNGRLSIVFPGLTGLGIDEVVLNVETQPSSTLFADGFETGDLSSWTTNTGGQ